MTEKKLPLTILDEFSHHTLSYDVLRYISLPSFLGEEKDTLLYFIGRNLARKFEIETMDDLYTLFKRLNWGNLEKVKQRRNSLTFHLMADEVAKRMLSSLPVDFRLESGFIAEAIEMITRRQCECTEKVNERLYRVQFKLIFTD